MDIKIVPISCKTATNKSKYTKFWETTFPEDKIHELKSSIEQIRGNPNLGVMIDISDIKSLSNRKNRINERGSVVEDGTIKTYGSIAKSFAKFLSSHGITNVYFTIKEHDDKVYVTIKHLQNKSSNSVNASS